MKAKVLLDRVLVKKEVESKTTSGGIIIPDTIRSNNFIKATVITCGKDIHDIIAGEVLLITKNTGIDISVGEDTLTILREGEILCKLYEEE